MSITVNHRVSVASLAACGIAAVIAVVTHWAVRRAEFGWMMDLKVYLAAAQNLLDGRSFYDVPVTDDGLMFQYPVFGALLFIPVAGLDPTVVGLVLNLASMLALQTVVWICAGRVGAQGMSRTVIAVVVPAVFVLGEPVEGTLLLGQVNILLMAAVVWDCTRRPGTPWQGVALGLAAGIKLLPGVFIVYLLLTRRFRAAATAVAVFTATTVIGALIRPADSWSFWTGVTGSPKGEAPEQVFTHSLWSVLVRAFHSTDGALPWWVIIATVVAVTGTSVAVALGRSGAPGGHRDLLGLCCLALTEFLVLPIAWGHYWVWLPALAVLTVRTGRLVQVAVGVLCAVTFLRVFHWGIELDGDALSLSTVQVVQTSLYTVTTVLVVIALARFVLVRPTESEPIATGTGSEGRDEQPRAGIADDAARTVE